MNYATQYHSRYYQDADKQEATTVTQTGRQVRLLDAKTQRCKRSEKVQTAIRTDNHVANGFLKCAFLPKLQATQAIQACKKSEKTERDFYQSLSQLAKHYGLKPTSLKPPCGGVGGYPYNISLALDDIRQQLKSKVANFEAIRLIQQDKKTFLICEERYNTGTTLYYIPVIPLYRLSKNPKRKQAVQLLQSVCSYLYHVADVPYYRQENSYLYWTYQMINEWILSDEETEDTPAYSREIAQAQWIGDFMEKKIYNPNNLQRFKKRLENFIIKDSFDNDCFLLACEALALYEQYPNERICRNACTICDTEEYEGDEIASMDKYVSFCADAKGMLFQTLFDNVNMELKECGEMAEPVIQKCFDGTNLKGNNLDFESRLFPLIEKLIYTLDCF